MVGSSLGGRGGRPLSSRLVVRPPAPPVHIEPQIVPQTVLWVCIKVLCECVVKHFEWSIRLEKVQKISAL